MAGIGENAALPSGPVAIADLRMLRPGQNLGSALGVYTIGDYRADGFFSHVWNCTDQWGNDLVVKLLKFRGYAHHQIEAYARREADILANVRNPFVTHIHDAFAQDNQSYIVVERCNFTLEDMFAQTNVSLFFMPLARCLLQALHSIHAYGFVHKDIHPGNIFATSHWDSLANRRSEIYTFKVGDLGIAESTHSINRNGLFKTAIKPPEVADPGFGNLGVTLDIYQAGLVLLSVMLNQKMEFTQPDHLAGEPRRLAEELPAPWNVALGKALRRRVAFRTSSALEMWRDLHRGA